MADNPCLRTNCGEAGCIRDKHNRPLCMCVDRPEPFWVPPDKQLLCPPVNITHLQPIHNNHSKVIFDFCKFLSLIVMLRPEFLNASLHTAKEVLSRAKKPGWNLFYFAKSWAAYISERGEAVALIRGDICLRQAHKPRLLTAPVSMLCSEVNHPSVTTKPFWTRRRRFALPRRHRQCLVISHSFCRSCNSASHGTSHQTRGTKWDKQDCEERGEPTHFTTTTPEFLCLMFVTCLKLCRKTTQSSWFQEQFSAVSFCCLWRNIL